MVATVPERVTVCVGSCFTSCAQAGRARARANPDALRIAVLRFMTFSFLDPCRTCQSLESWSRKEDAIAPPALRVVSHSIFNSAMLQLDDLNPGPRCARVLKIGSSHA